MKKNTIALDITHPDKKRVEYFLNSINQTLEQVPFDWRNWNQAKDIVDGVKFHGDNPLLTITVIFATSYWEASKIDQANALSKFPNAKSGVNGDVLYLVESVDEDRLDEVAGIFAGRE